METAGHDGSGALMRAALHSSKPDDAISGLVV